MDKKSEAVMKKHFVTFYSPGSFVAETSEMPIESWDIEAAKKMARKISERYGATPYGFRFTTRGRSAADLDSKKIAESCFYWLGGRVETLEQVAARGESILLSNMRGNGWDKVVTNDNSYRWTQPLEPSDVVLEWAAPTKKAKRS